MSTDAPASLRPIAERVEGRLEQFLAPELERWAAFDPQLVEPMAEIRRLVMSGGKRLRPAFCHWAFVGCGGDPDDPIVIDAGPVLSSVSPGSTIVIGGEVPGAPGSWLASSASTQLKV